MQKRLISLLKVMRNAFRLFSEHDPLRLAGATAFFTTFALPAVLFVILQVLRLFLSQKESSEELFSRMSMFVGREAARHLFTVLKNFESIAAKPIATIIGLLFLLFVATTLFKVIKNSLNDLWQIKVTQKMSVRLVLTTRMRELAIIVSAGLLLLITLFFEGVQMAVRNKLAGLELFASPLWGDAIGLIIAVAVVTLWFGLIFCFLPDARIPIEIGFRGALLTSVLFNAGKIVLRSLLFNSNLGDVFGASASVVLILLFVFYSSMIFYFGAAFTRAMVDERGDSVEPLPYAAHLMVKASKND
jgi:membrane protein